MFFDSVVFRNVAESLTWTWNTSLLDNKIAVVKKNWC